MEMKNCKMINKIITVFMVSSVLLCGEITSAYAAGLTDRGSVKTVALIVMIVGFIAASAISAYITYRIRMRKKASGIYKNETVKKRTFQNDEQNL